MLFYPYNKFLLKLHLLVSILFLSSCGGGNVDTLIKDAARDRTISLEEWNAIVSFAEQKDLFKDDSNNFSPKKLKHYIENYAKSNMRGIDHLIFDDNIPIGEGISSNAIIPVKLYIERSGSMVPYDTPSTKGEFKNALISLLNSLPQSSNEDNNTIYIVNDAVYPYNVTLRDFIRSKSIFDDTKSIGDSRYTDFTCIFDSVLTRTKKNELSIFVSDMIYSTKEFTAVNPEKILTEAEGITTSTFKGYNDTDVLIMKLKADYNGNYYSYNSPSKGIHYAGDRPYYIMLVASTDVMRNILTNESYKEFRNFEALKGFENYYCFTKTAINPDYSILLSDSNNCGRFNAQKGQKREIHKIENFKPDRNGNRAFTVALNLSAVPVPEKIKTDPDSYHVESLSGFIIEDISPIKTNSERITKYVPNATHKMTISTSDEIKNEIIQISLKNELPCWIKNTNSSDDTDTRDPNFENTTFAFEHFMNGIYKAFYPSTDNPEYFSITIGITK